MHSVARRSAEKILTDTVRLIDPKTSGTLNETTFSVTLPADEILWEGPALVVSGRRSSTTDDAGGPTSVDDFTLRVPMAAPDVRPGTIAIVQAAGDPGLVGESFEVVRSATRSRGILRRYVLRRRVPHSSVSTA